MRKLCKQTDNLPPGRPLPPLLRPLYRLASRALGLQLWKIDILIQDQLQDPSHAGITYYDHAYYRAVIILQEQQGRIEAEETLIHELLHLGLYEIDAACSRLLEQLPEEEQQEQEREYMRQAVEQTIERLARSLRPILLRALKP